MYFTFNVDIVIVHRAQLEVLSADDYTSAIDADANFVFVVESNALVVLNI